MKIRTGHRTTKIPRPSGSIGQGGFYHPETLSNSYIIRHQGYNVFANNDSTIDEPTPPQKPLENKISSTEE